MRVLTFLPVLIFWSSFPVIFIWVPCRSFAPGIALLKICQQRECVSVALQSQRANDLGSKPKPHQIILIKYIYINHSKPTHTR